MSRIRIVERTGSTNADLIADPAAREGDWLVALEQVSGRGRQGREWTSTRGNFHGSTLIELGSGDPSPQTLSLVAGLALIEALDAAAPGLPLLLKWPNDLLAAGKKAAGILLERSGDRVVIGFGVNLAVAPALLDRNCAALGGTVDPQAFAPLLARSMGRLLALWRQSAPGLIARAWLARAHPIGTELKVHSSADAWISGRFEGIEPDGALRLRRADGGLEIIRAGDVEL